MLSLRQASLAGRRLARGSSSVQSESHNQICHYSHITDSLIQKCQFREPSEFRSMRFVMTSWRCCKDRYRTDRSCPSMRGVARSPELSSGSRGKQLEPPALHCRSPLRDCKKQHLQVQRLRAMRHEFPIRIVLNHALNSTLVRQCMCFPLYRHHAVSLIFPGEYISACMIADGHTASNAPDLF